MRIQEFPYNYKSNKDLYKVNLLLYQPSCWATDLKSTRLHICHPEIFYNYKKSILIAIIKTYYHLSTKIRHCIIHKKEISNLLSKIKGRGCFHKAMANYKVRRQEILASWIHLSIIVWVCSINKLDINIITYRITKMLLKTKWIGKALLSIKNIRNSYQLLWIRVQN